MAGCVESVDFANADEIAIRKQLIVKLEGRQISPFQQLLILVQVIGIKHYIPFIFVFRFTLLISFKSPPQQGILAVAMIQVTCSHTLFFYSEVQGLALISSARQNSLPSAVNTTSAVSSAKSRNAWYLMTLQPLVNLI